MTGEAVAELTAVLGKQIQPALKTNKEIFPVKTNRLALEFFSPVSHEF